MSDSFANVLKEIIPKKTKSVPLQRSTRALVSRINDWLEESRKEEPPRSPGFHVSALFDLCPRKEALVNKLGVEVLEETFDAKKLLTFAIGHAYHDLVQNKILAKSRLIVGVWKHSGSGEEIEGHCPDGSGLWVYQEPRVVLGIPGVPESERWRIVGSCDGDLADGRLLEAKSCGIGIYSGLDKGYASLDGIDDWYTACGKDGSWAQKYARSHSFQLRLYLCGLDRQEGVVFYLPKGQPPKGEPAMKEFIIRKLPGAEEAAREKVRSIFNAWAGGEWGGPLPRKVCGSPACKRAKDCPVVTQCFAESDS